MAQQVEVPGVGVLEFPDNMPQEAIASAIQKNFPQIHNQPQQQEVPRSNEMGPSLDIGALGPLQTQQPPEQVQVPPPQQGDASFGNRFVTGLTDPIHGGAQALTHMLPEGLVNAVNRGTQAVNEAPIIGPITKALGMTPANSAQIDAGIQQREQALQAARKDAGQEGIDWARMGGNVLSAAPMAAAIPPGASLLPRMLSGALSGTLGGAVMPVTEGDYGDQKTRQMALSAGLGAVAGPATSAVASMVKPNTSPEVKALMAQGITPTPGQILGGTVAKTEDKLTSLPLIGDMISGAQRRGVEDFNRAAYARALDPIGAAVPKEVGREGIEGVKSALTKSYDDLLPKLQFKADQQFSSELQNLTGLVQNAQTNPQVAQQFNKVLQNDVLSRISKSGAMDGRNFKDMESALGQSIKKYSGSSNPADQDIAAALGEVLKSARETLSRSNPNYADQLSKINQGYANFVRLRDAASKVGADEGIFTPAQLQNAVRSMDKSAGKGRFATGDALMQDLSEAGKTVLGSKYPDSGTAGRSMVGAGAAGGLAMINPKLLAAALAATLPYTKTGGKITAAALTKRPESFKAISDALRASAPAIAGSLPLAIGTQNQSP